jgi:hypothetical protein
MTIYQKFQQANDYVTTKSLGLEQKVLGDNFLTQKREVSMPDSKDIASAVAGVYMLSSLGCAGYNVQVNGVQFDTSKKQLYANSGDVGTDVKLEESNKPWYKDWRYLAGIAAGVIIIGGVTYALTRGGGGDSSGSSGNNDKDKDPTPPPNPPPPPPKPE